MKTRKKWIIVLGVLVVLNIFAWNEVYNLSKPRFLEVFFFDVGQGDGALVKTPAGHKIIIDGGPNSSLFLEKLAKEIPFYDRTIDLIILTHPHSDHLRGLLGVLESYDVQNIIWTGVIEGEHDFKKWEDLLIGRENVFIAQAGLRVFSKNVSIDILHPFENLEGQKFKDSNNTSIVNRLVYNNIAFLFTGDVNDQVERELIRFRGLCKESWEEICEIMTLDSNVLKIGHHGSKTSTSEDFIIAVSPEIAVISAGKDNRHGHPHKEVLAILNNFGIDILRTDEIGDIKIISNGDFLKIADY